ncbi:MAG: M23 family metallopeptidase [Gammaproteobacteria bacterium]|nr:MAG: M23 family metallopeptidase [Gammaproteobacteria bacterium]
MGLSRWLNLLLSFLLVASVAAAVVAAGPAGIELSTQGSFRQGGLVVARTEPGTRVDVRGAPVRVSSQGVFLIGVGRDETGPVAIDLQTEDGRERHERFEVEARQYRIQRIDGLPAEKVTPPSDVLERIRKEAAAARKARTRDDPRTDFLDGFVWPVEGRITGVYGSQRILNGEPRRPHFGVDVAGPVGMPVVAPADALVTLVNPDMYYSGGTLIMDHGHGLSSTFIHLSRILVQEGQSVTQGQVVAEIGATGRATGPHLDWRMNLFDIRLDPAPIAGPMPQPRKQ